MSIPVRNIYHMLSYAWDKSREAGQVDVDLDSCNSLPELFARVLLSGSRILFKRGILHDYTNRTEELGSLKGKIEISDTLKKVLHLKQRAICTYDEYSPDVLPNRILISTLLRLSEDAELDRTLKAELRKCVARFPAIDVIQIQARHFLSVRYGIQNRFYDFLIQVCRLVYENSIPLDGKGKWKFSDFSRDHDKMSRLFEAFVRKFYQVKLSTNYRVSGTVIQWQMDGDTSFLPQMKTDITIENVDFKMIIDAKYYHNATKPHYGKESLISSNLYQLFTYLINQEDGSEKTEICKGVLLYPTTDREYDVELTYKKHPIAVKTVNLNAYWADIETRLLAIV